MDAQKPYHVLITDTAAYQTQQNVMPDAAKISGNACVNDRGQSVFPVKRLLGSIGQLALQGINLFTHVQSTDVYCLKTIFLPEY